MVWLSIKEIDALGFSSVGENIYLSNKASFYNCSKITIGNNVRIDDFCVLSAGDGGIKLGDYIHLSVYSALIGAGKITVSDFCNISSRAIIYSSNDDYSGAGMTGPMVPSDYTAMYHADVFLEEHVIIGSGSIILPGVTIEIGGCIGALSLVRDTCHAFCIYGGVPAKFIKERKRDLLNLEKLFLAGGLNNN